MRFIKILLLILFSINIQNTTKATNVPASFADLAEKLMPSVVNISTTTTVTTRSNPFPFEFPPGSPFEDMFKDYGTPQKRQTSALGSGFIIDENGIVKVGSFVKEQDILIGKLTPCEEDPSPEAKLLRALENKSIQNFRQGTRSGESPFAAKGDQNVTRPVFSSFRLAPAQHWAT